MTTKLAGLGVLLLTLVGCGNGDKAGGAVTDSGAGDTDDGLGGSGDRGALDLQPAWPTNDGHFATGEVCSECHSNADAADAMRDDEGAGIAPYDLWQATMMANAARDPLFWAVVSAEMAAAPELADEIMQTCSTCHAPMAVTDAKLHGEDMMSMEELFSGKGDRAQFGLDGVSCTTCHQIVDEGLGEWESFSGGYKIEADGKIYGPHADPETRPMENHTSFTPTESQHVLDPGLCATCHTLETETLDEDGAPSGVTMMEQGAYLEWRSSSFAMDPEEPDSGVACQGCHVPQTDIDGDVTSTAIARNPHGSDFGWAEDREPFGRHVFVGGNAWMVGLIKDNADVLSPPASEEAFDASIAAIRDQLANRTAALSLRDVSLDGGVLTATVSISVMTGHKFPTGHPSRRAWLVFEVEDADGTLLFRSGGVDSLGRLVDGEGTVLASESRGGTPQVHLQTLTDDSQVQVYESVMQGLDGEPNFRLLAGAGYWKDNRLLPGGWDPSADDLEHIAPVGVDGDDDFSGGGDAVAIELSGIEASGPLTVRASLVYQSVSARYLDELAAYDTPQVGAFLTMAEASDRTPDIVDTAETTVD